MTLKTGSILIATIATAMAFEAQARADIHAEGVVNLLLRNGEDAGRINRDENGRERALNQAYPGGEQTTMVQLANDELLIFGMGSYRLNGELPRNRMQTFCASVTMDAINGPVLNSMAYITDNVGDDRRNANHPEAFKVFNGEVAYLEYNIGNNNNNRAERFGAIVGPGCQVLAPQTRVQAKNNDDCSETNGQQSTIVVEQTDTVARLYSIDGCNGNGRDNAWFRETRITRNGPTSFAIEKIQDTTAEENEERSRGTFLATNDPTLAVACWTAGNTQAPNKGVRCAGLDTTTAAADIEDRLLWRQYVMRREGEVYATQIRIANVLDAAGNPTSMAVGEYEKLINPGKRRGKGAAQRQMIALNFTRAGMDVMTAPNGNFALGRDVTHGTITSGLWGVDGQASSAVFGLYSSVIGQPGSNATLAVFGFNPEQRQLVEGRLLSTGAAIDNAHLPNIYGNNPNTQGRNYNQLVTGIRNPGYQVPGGFASDVKLFAGIPATTRRIRTDGTNLAEDKLATELVLIPQVVAPSAPVDPDPVNQIEPPVAGEPVGPTNNGALGGCSVNGSASGSLLTLLGLALLAVIRRRK